MWLYCICMMRSFNKTVTYVTVNNFKHNKHTYIDHQIQHSSNWHRLWREAGDGCPILTDIQFSTRLASNSDRVVTLRNMVQVGALTESIWCQYNRIQYNVMEFYELGTKVCMYIRELLLSNYVAESNKSNWLLDVSGLHQPCPVPTDWFCYHICSSRSVCKLSQRSNQQLQNHNNPIITNIHTGSTYHPNQQLVFRPPQYI